MNHSASFLAATAAAQHAPQFYTGRFAPSPTGALHAGSLVAALASWLDARAHQGRWLVRIEDIDSPRCSAASAHFILYQLAQCGLLPDAPPEWQSQRDSHYEKALAQLCAQSHAYPCACSRSDIASAQAAQGTTRQRHSTLIYPGTCRSGLNGKTARAWRLHTESTLSPQINWFDRRLGAQTQNVAQAVGDFILRRADGLWAYQLAVVVDDAAQQISHIVRGEDLADNTARQILLQKWLGYPTPHYLHTPLVYHHDGAKLSKQNGAQPLDLTGANAPLQALQKAASVLGLPSYDAAPASSLNDALAFWVQAWRKLYNKHF